MRSAILKITLLLVMLPSLSLYAEDYNTQQQKQTATKTTQAKQYSSQATNRDQRSRKCAIYSGICPMRRSATVGDYCICHTPSGPIHGVVIP
ncbi:MAG: hypothetical protein ABW092_02275 [Candidatus Thiodiazotropha sp.]